MEDEIFTVYDADGTSIGSSTRAIVHRVGYWHRVIHVWIYDEKFVYLQQRSHQKKDYAGLFDITTAGHIDADELAEVAAMRECQEEIGLVLKKADLQFLGTIKEAVFSPDLLDKEIAHIYIYKCMNPCFAIGEEVEGMYKVYKQDLKDFANDKRLGINIYDLDNQLYTHASASQLCQHGSSYYRWLLEHMV